MVISESNPLLPSVENTVNEVLHYVLNDVNEVLYTVNTFTAIRISNVWEYTGLQVVKNTQHDNKNTVSEIIEC